MRSHMRSEPGKRILNSELKEPTLCGIHSDHITSCWNNCNCMNCREAIA